MTRQPILTRELRSGEGRCIAFLNRSGIFAALVLFSLIACAPHSDATIFNVGTTSDIIGSTLRNAINSANLSAGRDTIVFAIPGSGPQTILVLSQLPQLTDPAGVMINGFSQPGSAIGSNPPATLSLMVVLDGSSAGFAHGLWILSPLNIVQGLVIQNFERDGIRIQATPPGTHSNMISFNFIGTNVTGMIPQGNGRTPSSPWAGVNMVVDPGMLGTVQNNIVHRCLVSANYSEGVAISSCPPGDAFMNTVDGNYIGTTANGMLPLGNRVNGVYIGEAAHDNLVINNIISANDTDGVCIVGYVDQTRQWFTRRNTVTRNLIGLGANRSLPLPNKRHGVSIGIYGSVWLLGFAPENVVSLDTIVHNIASGVMIWEHPINMNNSDRNRITQNAIFGNGALGIDLNNDGVSANDPNDLDSAANQTVNMPVITSAIQSGTSIVVSGTLGISTPPATATVEVFKAGYDPTGYGEGSKYLGSAAPTTAGLWSVTVPAGLAIGDSVTATAIDQNGNTSEFAQILTVVLPVELLSFSATDIGGAVHLRWTTTSESGNAGFEILRRCDQGAYESVGWVDGHGTTAEAHSYFHADRSACSSACELLFYRLRQVDFDGCAVLSPEVTVERRTASPAPRFQQLFPNPVRDLLSIGVSLPTAMPVSIVLYDTEGTRLIDATDSAIRARGGLLFSVDVSRLPAGAYLIYCKAGDTVETLKCIVRK
jgi:hypothetical protein